MTRSFTLSFACLALLAAPMAFAQPAAPTPPAAPRPVTNRGGEHGMGGGSMGIVPPGTWWKNADTITALSLTADQQKKMDDMFLQSRIALIHLHASLEEEQLKLEPLLNVNPPDQAKSLAQISKIADLRADLEKANAKMLLGLRSVLTADQWTKLQTEQHARHERPRDERPAGRGDGHGQSNGQGRGPQGPQGQGRPGPQNGPPPPAAPDVE